jgi:hypothetical protein
VGYSNSAYCVKLLICEVLLELCVDIMQHLVGVSAKS